MKEYEEFIAKKYMESIKCGFTVEIQDINKSLFEWQKHICKWALIKGKCAIFADCGLGKTIIELEWARHISEHTNKPVLIIAPLAVSKQTKREGDKFGIPAQICACDTDVKPGINITNYEKLDHFDCSVFGGVVLDESSILKSFSSATRKLLTEKFCKTPYKLCATATPSPNDFMEIGNHADFLDIMSRTEMLATYFVHDMDNTQSWRLKGHAESKFFQWIGSWAVMMKTPGDIGFSDCRYDLPELNIITHIVDSPIEETEARQTVIFQPIAQTLDERRSARKGSMINRADKAVSLINSDADSQWLIWCDYNYESEMLKKLIDGAVEVRGSDTPAHKENSAINFADGQILRLVSKPSIFGFGLNFQQCHNMIFYGLSDSYESFYQAVRRCWRFGQDHEVNVHVIVSEREISVLENIKRKQSQMDKMTSEMIKLTKDTIIHEIQQTTRITEEYRPTERAELPEWLRSA